MGDDESYYFELFAHTARFCALDVQEELVSTVRRILDGQFDLEQAVALSDEIRQSLPRLHVAWDDDTLEWSQPAALHLTLGVPRCVLVEVENRTSSVQAFRSYFVDPRDSNTAFTQPSESRDMVAPLRVDYVDGLNVDLFVRSGTDVRTLSVPVTTSEPARIVGTVFKDGALFPARVRVRGADAELRHGEAYRDNETLSEKAIAPPFYNKGYKLPFFYCDGSFEVLVPPGWIDVSAERGFEHQVASQRVFVESGETMSVALEPERFVDLPNQDWYSGDTHVHWVKNSWDENEDLDLLAMVQRAEDVHVVNNLTLRHFREGQNLEFIKPDHAPMGPVPEYDFGDYWIAMGEEFRNSPFYAHLNLLNLVADPPADPSGLVQPISTGNEMGSLAEDYPINATAIELARMQQPLESRPIVTTSHGVAGSAPAEIALGMIDSLDQIFVDDYYRVLDCGFRLPLTDGADHPARLVGETRCYVQVEGELSYGAWIDGILSGATFTTSGPLLFLTVDGAGPGGEVEVAEGAELNVALRAFSRRPLGTVQILCNGELVYDADHGETALSLSLPLPALESAWWVARCSALDEPIFRSLWERDTAHTSAVYVVVDGVPIFNDTGAAENLRDRCQSGADFVTQSALFYAPDMQKKLERARNLFERGRDAYQALLDQ